MSAPNWLSRTHDDGLGCYIHIPFCDRICPYCDFAVVLYRETYIDRYVNSLLREMAQCSRQGPLQTLYLGGGTPSALPRRTLERVLSTVFTQFNTSPGSIECTLEANPARNRQDLEAWCAVGVNRLSVGVQSFDDRDLHKLGRDHTGDDAIDFCRAARAAGFTNISVDLIAGAPGQDDVTFESTLSTALSLDIDHISIYGLTIEEGTPYAAWYRRDPRAFPDDDAVAMMLERAHDTLSSAGFVHYEISNFARPGFESAHNTGYWRQRDCVAFGVSAAGYEAGLRYRNHRNFDAYCGLLESGASARAEEERLDADARLGEAAMLALRTAAGIDYDDFLRRFGVRVIDVFDAPLKKCLAAGLLEQDDRGARLVRRGRLLANTVCAEFLVPQRSPVVSR